MGKQAEELPLNSLSKSLCEKESKRNKIPTNSVSGLNKKIKSLNAPLLDLHGRFIKTSIDSSNLIQGYLSLRDSAGAWRDRFWKMNQ